jgi:NAD(P)-dependent dehydrogenase (short-subunit alcohol dehydrogenase family)
MTDISARTRVDGQVAVVTGGGSGIGAACCEVLAAAGAHVVALGRTRAKLDAVTDRIRGTAIVCDVSRWSEVETAFRTANEIKGRIDILINNAGVPGPIAPLDEVDLDAWRACMDVNLFGALHCLKAAAAVMKRQGGGSIVNVSSLMGIQGYPMRTAYCASKFALVGMTEAAARELGPHGVRVNALLPGAVSGANMDRVLEQRARAEETTVAEITRRHYTEPAALKRWVDPVEVGLAALYYASSASGATTGDKMKVDCGRF